jgi:cytosine/uracil/thiamine/allantoin permease
MKKLLNIISWSCFILSVIMAAVATLCSVAGMLILISVCLGSGLLNLVTYCAIGYFISFTVLVLIYGLLCLYQAIEKVVRKNG